MPETVALILWSCLAVGTLAGTGLAVSVCFSIARWIEKEMRGT